jgi:hypothetical protein
MAVTAIWDAKDPNYLRHTWNSSQGKFLYSIYRTTNNATTEIDSVTGAKVAKFNAIDRRIEFQNVSALISSDVGTAWIDVKVDAKPTNTNVAFFEFGYDSSNRVGCLVDYANSCFKLRYVDSGNQGYITSAANGISNGDSFLVGISWSLPLQKLAISTNGLWIGHVEATRTALNDGFTEQRLLVGNLWESFGTSTIKVSRVAISGGYKDQWHSGMQYHLTHIHNTMLSTQASLDDFTMALMRNIR